MPASTAFDVGLRFRNPFRSGSEPSCSLLLESNYIFLSTVVPKVIKSVADKVNGKSQLFFSWV